MTGPYIEERRQAQATEKEAPDLTLYLALEGGREGEGLEGGQSRWAMPRREGPERASFSPWTSTPPPPPSSLPPSLRPHLRNAAGGNGAVGLVDGVDVLVVPVVDRLREASEEGPGEDLRKEGKAGREG